MQVLKNKLNNAEKNVNIMAFATSRNVSIISLK